jgi:hypothetical protein
MKNRVSFTLFSLLPFLLIVVDVKIYWVFHLLLLFVVVLERKFGTKFKSHLFLLLVIPLFWTCLFSFSDSLYFTTQALFYLTTPILLLIVGMKMSRVVNQKLVFKYIIYFGTIGALYYTGLAFFNFGLNSFADPYAIRDFSPWGSIASVMAVFLIMFSKKYGFVLIKNQKFKYCLIGVNLIAIYFSASRTYYFIFMIFAFVFLYHYNKKLTVVFIGLSVFLYSAFLVSDSDNKLINKFQTSTAEVSIGNYQVDEDINVKYRGYETAMALEAYWSGTEMNLLFGHGFEKQVDLKADVLLGDKYRRIIPIIHNGYLYILIKTGFFGLLFFGFFFLKLYRLKRYVPDFLLLNMLLAACIVSLLFSNYVVGTFFSMEMSVLWVLFGIYIGYVEIARRRNSFAKPLNK